MRPILQSPKRSSRRRNEAPPTASRPAAERPATPPAGPPVAQPVEPSPELMAHFKDPATRKRLLGHLRWRLVPERNREDIVQKTLTDAWKQRHSWPATIEELDKLLFTILRGDRLDLARKESRAPLLGGETDQDAAGADAGHTSPDADPPEPSGMTVSNDAQEQRVAIRQAMDYAESRPRLKYPMRWLLQMYMGVSAREIAHYEKVTENVVYLAVSDLRAELRGKFGRMFLLIAIASLVWAIIHLISIGRVNDQAHPPQPVPTVVAPPPAPAPSPAPVAPAQPAPRTRGTSAGDKPPR